MPDFAGSSKFYLRQGAAAVPISWGFAAASSATANDGSLPYATTIASVALALYDPDGNDLTTRMVEGSPSVDGTGLIVSAELNYPEAVAYDAGPPEVAAADEGPEGIYQAVITATLSSGAVIAYECRRIAVLGVP